MRLGGSRAGTDPNDATYRWWETTQAEQDHTELPLDRRWRLAGTVVGIVVIAIVVVIVSIERDEDPAQYEPLTVATIERGPSGSAAIDDVEVEIDRNDPATGRVLVTGDDLVRVDVTGDGLCDPVSGAPDTWLEIGVCATPTELTIEGHDGDGETTVAVARF